MFERILTPTDFSEATERVLEVARAVATRYASRIHLIHVDEERAMGMHSSDDLIHFMNDVDARRTEWMEQLAASFMDDGFEVELVRAEGVASEVILRHAREQDIGLIVLGTRGAGGLASLLMGSTSIAVLRGAPCPVLSINHERLGAGEFTTDKILFPTDFSDTSLAGLELVAQVARDFEADIEVLHVLKAPTYIPAIPGEPPFYVPRQAFDTAHARSLGKLRALKGRPELAGLNVAFDAILAADTPHGIVAHAEQTGCGMIVIPRGGRGAIGSILFGRVVSHVVKLSPFPVLSFRPALG